MIIFSSSGFVVTIRFVTIIDCFLLNISVTAAIFYYSFFFVRCDVPFVLALLSALFFHSRHACFLDWLSSWYNRNGWLGVKHQVTYLPWLAAFRRDWSETPWPWSYHCWSWVASSLPLCTQRLWTSTLPTSLMPRYVPVCFSTDTSPL